GVGALSMSFFTPRVLSLLGLAFLGAGTLTLFLPAGHDALKMGLTFGALHLVYGIRLSFAAVRRHALVTEERGESRAEGPPPGRPPGPPRPLSPLAPHEDGGDGGRRLSPGSTLAAVLTDD